LLLEHRADANAADGSGSTPLHCCLNWPINTTLPDDIWKVKILLENGADVNALSRDGISILRQAFDYFCSREGRGHVYRDGAVAVIRLLIAHGADVSKGPQGCFSLALE
jgi:ankyrin repeat protein